MNHFDFFKVGLKNIKTIGTISRSSSHLCKRMIKPIDFENAKVLVEFGAGDGVITRHILKKMRKDAVLFSFEVSNHFLPILKKIKDNRLHIIGDSAELIKQVLSMHNHTYADAIISALPLVNLPKELKTSILLKSYSILRPGSLYIQMHYSLIEKKNYEQHFDKIKIDFEPLNIPPAFVFICTKMPSTSQSPDSNSH